MAKCTNCKNVLPFSKVALLSKRKNRVECTKCHTVLEAEQKQLGTIGGIFGAIGGLLGFLTVYGFLNNVGSAALFLSATVIVMLGGAIHQNRVIRLKPEHSKSEDRGH